MTVATSGTAKLTLPAAEQILIEREFAAPAVQHTTAPARDMHIGSGMEAGMQDAFDRLEQVASSLA